MTECAASRFLQPIRVRELQPKLCVLNPKERCPMKTAIADKWLLDLPPDEPAHLAAVRTLQSRLDAVQCCLPPAADQADEDTEHVHQLRVWTRRATAAVGLYQEMMPARRFGWLKKQLQRIRRAANDARDCDVLIQRLKQKRSSRGSRRWLEVASTERAEAQQAVVAVRDRLQREDRFARRIGKLLERVGARGEKHGRHMPPFNEWARARLHAEVERFFAAVPSDPADAGGLHQFRIRGKQLRYVIELLAAAFPERLRTALYPVIEAMQDRLGEINDLATAQARLRQKIERADKPAEVNDWRRLLAAEQAQFDQARQKFWDWCTPAMLAELHGGFDALLKKGTQLISPARPVSRNGRAAKAEAAPPADPPAADVPAAPPLAAAESVDGTMTKAKIVGELGEQELLLPALVNEGLLANDRAKYLMTLLQAARTHADQPDEVANDLKQERLACGVLDTDLDEVVGQSRKENADVYHIPAARRVHDGLIDNLRRMIAPVSAQNGAGNGATYEKRLQTLLGTAPPLTDDAISGTYISQLTSGPRADGDSLHVLVMDLHKELNRLQQRLASESIDGAQVYGLREEDRPLVAAFMAGVNQTRALKFDHPGLGTTATRSGPRLILQNDIGMTQAHVLVVHVEGNRVTLTYTDVHMERLVFFQGLFERFAVHWEDTVSRRTAAQGEDLYHLCLGTYTAQDPADLLAYLTFLGSRLVFLIDWNKARKRLRKFAPRRVCLDVLRWGADQDVGHRGFLALGGEQLIFDALQTAGRVPLPPGGQLSDLLGAERTAEFLKFTLETASKGLRSGQSEFLIRDEISAELRHYIDTVHQGLLEVAAEHATLVVELAMAARDLLATGAAADRELVQRAVLRAKKWEHCADELLNRCRKAPNRGDESAPILDLLITADDSADALEEAIYRLSLLDGDAGSTAALLQDLAGLVAQGAQEYLKAVENARRLYRGSPREQVADFLEAVDRTMTAEHETDDAHRRAQAAIVDFVGDFKQWHQVSGTADRLEEAADALMRSVLILRDYILGVVLRR
jgi:CHAD domain-containing protein/uncharacterized protein Yka (UPF0111/DUF47 family)